MESLRVLIWHCNVNFVLTDLVQGWPDTRYRLRFLWALVLPGFGLRGTVILLRTHNLKDGVFMDLMCRVCCNFGTDWLCSWLAWYRLCWSLGLLLPWLRPGRHCLHVECYYTRNDTYSLVRRQCMNLVWIIFNLSQCPRTLLGSGQHVRVGWLEPVKI